MRINIGCGMSPTPGWRNFDNSPALKLSKRPVLAAVSRRLGLLDPKQWDYIRYCKNNLIEFADGRSHLPLPDGSVEVFYTCHTLEHMDQEDARNFLKEALRVLEPGGIIRIVVPDLRFYAQKYVKDGDLDFFMFYLHLTKRRPRGFREKLKYLLVGDRHHQWMYDGPWLSKFLSDCGYADPRVLPPGSTTITAPEPLNLSERAPVSLYVEAHKPRAGACARRGPCKVAAHDNSESGLQTAGSAIPGKAGVFHHEPR